MSQIESLPVTVTRLGTVLEPNGDTDESAGILNPGATRDRDGRLLLYPRLVAPGNVSRIGIVAASGGEMPEFARCGVALEPKAPYELRESGGEGCEDARVTYLAVLGIYVMAYTAYGTDGPRIAIATSDDAHTWERLGLVDFSATGLPHGDDKDAAFFPEPVLSPDGVESLAFYHRPMLHLSAVDGCAAVPIILDLPPEKRESTRIGYVPLDAVFRLRANLLKVAESALVLAPDDAWGKIKNGAGTPPVRISEGWMSVFHGVDARLDDAGRCVGMRYCAGVVIHDAERPHEVRYRSPAPVLAPEMPHELRGVVNEVVFPTGIDVRPGAPAREFDLYYGMADERVGRANIVLGASSLAEDEENAA